MFDYGITLLEVSPEAERLAALYIQEGAVSAAWETDAAHIAMTTVNGLDFYSKPEFPAYSPALDR
jgi:hypothetical protein